MTLAHGPCAAGT